MASFRAAITSVIAIVPMLVMTALAAPVTLVAPTDKLSPEQQKATFKLPPGFEIQLVAAEPDIAKPMNIAFDDRGRLWVTDTIEYPWPAEPGKGRDSVKVLSDFSDDGRAKTITTFAGGLNIPLGVLPIGDGAIVYAIPEIRRYHDTDGDGKSDKSEKLLGGFGSVDTHGMTNNFVRGFDGYIYANHGFRNDSVVTGTDGQTVTMNSGNTYRFKPDGSKVQFHARGQVNPFGLAFDEWGNLFSADCHTRPQYMLLRGAVYPSFGKPDDGLGFGPEMCPHGHGSTGIAGTMVYAAEQFPAEYRGNLFNGNPVTNTINRDTIKWTGSTPLAVEQPDFLTSSDPWFRPVQVKLGPDGAMYIADFYNKIIGHYEVDLKHPGRDRTSGRIWRIAYKGDANRAPPPKIPDMAKASPEELVKLLGDSNLAVRMMATDRLADGDPAVAEPVVRKALASPTAATNQRIHSMWVLARWGKLSVDDLAAPKVFAIDLQNIPEQIHLAKVMAERSTLPDSERAFVIDRLGADEAIVRRAAAEALARHPDESAVGPLLAAAAKADPADTHLVHSIKISLREHLAQTPFLTRAGVMNLPAADHMRLIEAALGVQSPQAGAYAAECVSKGILPAPLGARALRHAVRFAGDDASIDRIAATAQSTFVNDFDMQLDALENIRTALQSRGGQTPESVRKWASQVVERVLRPTEGATDDALAWSSRPVDPAAAKFDDPWTPQSRKCADGVSADFWSSLPKGEKLTGVLRSKPFVAPAKLSLWIAGHNGLPTSKDAVKNLVRLVDPATGEVLADAPAARNDTAKKVTWDLTKVAGRQVAIEAVDADTRTAYAWIAFGRLEPAVVAIPASGQDLRKRLGRAVDLAGAMNVQSAAEPVRALLAAGTADAALRVSAAKAIAAIDPAGAVQPLVAVLNDPAASPALRDGCAAALGAVRDPSAAPAMLTAITVAPQGVQRTLALAMSGTRQGADALLAAVGAGKASPRLLLDKTVRDKLRAAGVEDFDTRLSTLTKGLPDVDAAVQKLIDDRIKAYATAGTKASADRGKAVFVKNCAACHRIGNDGAQIGPQLDGLGKRGVDRTVEDILDPSRNVDGAFRYSILTLDDGDVVTGLQRRIDGQTTVFADAQGKEFAVESKRIKKRTESQLSLMPANWGELMTQEEFGDLLAFLMK